MASTPPGSGGRGYRRQVLVNSLAGGLANGWTIVLSLVTLPFLLRRLGADAFGLWAVLLTFSATAGWFSLADLGLGVATVRAAASATAVDDDERAGAVVGSALALYGVLGLVSGAAFALVGPDLIPALVETPASQLDGLRAATRLFGAQVAIELGGLGLLAGLEGLQRLDRARATDSARRTLVALAIVVAAGGGLEAVARASLTASALGIAATAAVFRTTRRVPLHVSRSEMRRLLAYGGQVTLLRGTGVLHRTMDRLLVGAVLGPSAVVIVEIATQIQNGISAVLSATTQAATASASWLHARADAATLRELLLRGTKYSSLATGVAGTVAAVLGGVFIRLWVGPGYGGAYPCLVLAIVYLVSQAPLQLGSNLLQGIGEVRRILGPALAGVLVNLAASLALVPHVGAAGAFVGTLVGGSVLTPVLARNILRETGVRAGVFLRAAVLPLGPPLAAAGVGSAIALALPLGDLATLAVGGGLGLGAAGSVGRRWTTSAQERLDLLRSLSRS